MRQLEKRLSMIEFKQRASVRVAIVKIDGTRLQTGETAAAQLEQQAADIDFPVPASARQSILASTPLPGCISLHFFTNKEV